MCRSAQKICNLGRYSGPKSWKWSEITPNTLYCCKFRPNLPFSVNFCQFCFPIFHMQITDLHVQYANQVKISIGDWSHRMITWTWISKIGRPIYKVITFCRQAPSFVGAVHICWYLMGNFDFKLLTFPLGLSQYPILRSLTSQSRGVELYRWSISSSSRTIHILNCSSENFCQNVRWIGSVGINSDDFRTSCSVLSVSARREKIVNSFVDAVMVYWLLRCPPWKRSRVQFWM
jgi:hypothetical protein